MITSGLDKSLQQPLQILENVELSSYTTLNIGGNARYLVRAETEHQIASAVKFADENGLRIFVLGGGSNVLISDAGFDGLVVQIALTGISKPVLQTGDTKLISVGAGEDWDRFVAYCVEENFAGVECLSGIPGLVGGTPIQNVGAYGQEVADTIKVVRCFDRKARKLVTLSNANCGFSYRSSIFNSTHRERYIILSVTFTLRPNGEAKITYKDLLELFKGRSPSLARVREAVLNIRRKKSMVIDPEDANSKSVGSFFKNPFVTGEKLNAIKSSMGQVPHFEFGGMFKIPAAWLIEKAGFKKGYSLGNAGISSNHTLALINRGGASAIEIIVLKERIQEAVGAKFGIDLQPEPVFVGF